MRRSALAALVVTATFVLPAGPARGAEQPGQRPPPASAASAAPAPSPVFTFRDGRLVALVQELERLSPTAAEMMKTLREFGTPVVFGTVEGVLSDVRAEHQDYDPSRQRALGFMAPLVRPAPHGGGLLTQSIFVGIDLGRLDELFGRARFLPRPPDVSWSEIQRLETLALLGHELVHAYGLAMAGGDPRRGCLDPADGEPARLSCVVVGENLIRRDLGAPLDWGYGLAPLTELPARYSELAQRRAELRGISLAATRALRERASAPDPAD